MTLVCLMSLALPLKAQPVIDLEMRFDYAKELYQQEAFEAARVAFSQTHASPYEAESAYLLASSAIKAGHQDGEQLMQDFVESYPYHVYTKTAYLDIADYYFHEGNYSAALASYHKSDVYLTAKLLFRKGYCEFDQQKYDEALTTFKKLDGTFTTYQKDAAYFIGFIYHERENTQTAYTYLQEAFESELYRKPAIELYASALYQNRSYQELIQLVDNELTPVDNGLVLSLMADAQYALEKYRSAAGNYQKLLKTYDEFRNERNYFRAGFSHLKIENHEAALGYLKQSAVTDDSVGAYASYYLGTIYETLGNLPFAISSFENTAKYPTILKEDALYHQSICLMKLPNYAGAIEVLNNYKSEFQTGRFVASVNEMLSLAYAQTSDYDLAIQYIESLAGLSAQLKQTYQRVSFLKGVSLFNDKRFDLAAEVFQKSLIYDEYPDITQQTYYWMGESLSLLQLYDEALFYYSSINQSPDPGIYAKAIYGRAYSHYNLKNYEVAAEDFGLFESKITAEVNRKFLSDALLRMGDCQFALKAYQSGIEYYLKAEKSGNMNRDHIYYQIGLLSRYIGNEQQARQYFDKLIREMPKSPKADDAHFQMAQIDFEKGNENKAIKAYESFLVKYPTSNFVPFVLLNQAIAYDNEGNHELTITNYKAILDRFPRHQAANSALLGLQEKNGNDQFEAFDQYLQKYKRANPNSEALENIEFEAARANYYSQKYALAIGSLEKFIKTYPRSALISDATYLIGDAYYRREQVAKALPYFETLESLQDFPKYTKVLYRIAAIHSKMGNITSSNTYFHKLSQVSSSSKDKINVSNGLMENHFSQANYDSAVYYGDRLLANPRVDVLLGAQANLIIGKSEYQRKRLDEALKSLLPLVSNSPDERGAEAYYYISKIYFDQANYDRALESLFILTNNFQPYEKWLGEAYLLMADIYIETNELFQAKATLKSLIEHATLEDIKQNAQVKLKEIDGAIDTNE